MRPCLDCGRLAQRTRCPECTRAHARRTKPPERRLLDSREWRRLRDRAVKLQPWCSDCHATATDNPLTGDHLGAPPHGGRNKRSQHRCTVPCLQRQAGRWEEGDRRMIPCPTTRADAPCPRSPSVCAARAASRGRAASVVDAALANRAGPASASGSRDGDGRPRVGGG